MMRKWLAIIILLLPIWTVVAQDASPITLEITGANASELPTITVTANVLDASGRIVEGLTPADFVLGGALAEQTRIVNVENVTADGLPVATVLVIDTSTSMSGPPILAAREAARIFIENTDSNDPVAIVTFSNNARIMQDFTTDKDLLLRVIDGLRIGGQTALYDAAVLGVQVAARAPVPRRAVIFLSDGAEFGGASDFLREDGLAQAQANGVSTYTIGLGYGTDRSYLQELASGTNARNYESPAPDQLVTIYRELATLFRSQYVLTLESDVPADGTEYTFTLQAETASGASNTDDGIIRAPIPVPLVSFPDDVLTAPLSAVTTITPIIRADDEITDISATLNGESIPLMEGSLTLDPADYAPDSYTLAVTVTDIDGDSGSAETTFEIAALPPIVSLDALPEGALTDPVTVTVTASGQTAPQQAIYTLTGADSTFASDAISDAENGFPFELNPFEFTPGIYTLNAEVTNAGGASASANAEINIGAAAPQAVTVSGISEGQVIDEPVTIDVSAETQPGIGEPEISISVPAANLILDGNTLNPAALPPGETVVQITVTTALGSSTQLDVPVQIAALPPQLALPEIEEPVTRDQLLTISAETQTPLSEVTFQYNNDDVMTIDPGVGDSVVIPLLLGELDNGENSLTITVTNEGGESSSATLNFEVILPPTPTPTPDIEATANAQATSDAQALAATSDAQATVDAEAEAQATSDAQATVDAEATAEAQAEAQATSDAQATVDAEASAEAQAEAQATSDAQATVDAEATAEAQAQAQATSDAQATVDAEASAEAEAEAIAQATTDAGLTATSIAQDEATSAAEEEAATQTTEAQPTITPTEEPTATATVTPTDEPTDEPTDVPTLTPVGDIIEVESQEAPPAEGNLMGILLVGGGIALLLILLALLFFGRRSNDQNQS